MAETTTVSRRVQPRFGRYFEEFAIGEIYEHFPGRTITATDNIQFSLLTMNNHPMHCDHEFASKSEFGGPIVNSGLTLAIVLGMTVADVSGRAIANLGWKEINLVSPVFPGDTIYAESEVIEKRESRSRATQGIVTVKTLGKKADGAVFLSYTRSILVPKRDDPASDSSRDGE